MKKESVILGCGMLTLGCFIGLGIGFFVGVGGTFFRTKNLMDEAIANHPSQKNAANSNLRMKVVSKQFSWHFHYHGPDGTFGETNAGLISETNPLGLDFENEEAAQDDIHTSELVLPTDTAAFFLLTSADVIHGFSGLGDREQDVIPGTEIPFFETTNSAEKSGQIKCSQLCGAGHENHTAKFRIVSESKFKDWLSKQKSARESVQIPEVD